MTTRRLLFVTGTRADFGKLKPLIRAVAADPDLDYSIFVTGMHLLARYGLTVNEVLKEGMGPIHVFTNQDEGSQYRPDLILANTIQGLSPHVRETAPDLIVVHGDRVEALAGAIVGALTGTLTAHVEGGELSGAVDELLRHAVSKLSHLHFVANGEARRRLIQLGERPESVFAIGSPDIDVMLSDTLPTLPETLRHYDIPFAEYLVLIYHPVSGEPGGVGRAAAEVVAATKESGRNFVVVLPNNDPGAEEVLVALAAFDGDARFRVIPSMRFEYFLTLLKHAGAIVGNSSAGIREAPVYGVPTVNVGSRQRQRFTFPSIADVPAERAEILAALRNLPPSAPRSLHFGRGDSAAAFADCLRRPEVWETPHQKEFCDLEPAGALEQR